MEAGNGAPHVRGTANPTSETGYVPMSRRGFVIWAASAAFALILGAFLGAFIGFQVAEALAASFGTGGLEDFVSYGLPGAFVGLLIGTVLGWIVGWRLKRQWLGIDWERTEARLEKAFDAVAREVGSRFPTVTASSGSWATGYAHFYVGVSFMRNAHTDVVLQFACAPNESMRPGPEAPEAIGREIVRFDIERGTGEELAALDPLLLPADPKSTEYERAVTEYVKRTIVFLEEHKELVFDALRQAQLGMTAGSSAEPPKQA
jgi:hypothetical protein